MKLPALLLGLTAVCAPALAQDPGPTGTPAQGGEVTGVLPLGTGIEAPAQPAGVSSATYRRTAKVRPISRSGGDYEALVSSPISSLVRGLRGADQTDNFIDVVECFQKPLDDVRALFRFAKLIARAATDDLHPMSLVFVEKLFQR